MNNTKKNNIRKENKNDKLTINNDQLGENASEAFKSEDYDNTLKNKDKNKDIK